MSVRTSLRRQGQLGIAFTRIGLVGFGGGPAMIPLVHAEAVWRYGWMSDDEFADVLAIGNTLPGPIATKMAGTIGYRVAGIGGAINAALAIMLPSILAMIALIYGLGVHPGILIGVLLAAALLRPECKKPAEGRASP